MKLFRKGLVATLALAMALTSMPVSVFAAEEVKASKTVEETTESSEALDSKVAEFGKTQILSNDTTVTNSAAFPTGNESKTPVKTEGSIEITEAAGYAEGMYAQWKPVAGADGYIVYLSSSENGPWDAIDNELIRKYPDYYRADAVGISAGEYYMKVAAVKVTDSEANEEAPVAYAILKCTVTAADRSGFAFTNGKMPGAYNADGTLKPNAKVIYVTNGNFNSVVTSVKDAKGNAITFTGIQELVNNSGWWKYSKDPVCIRILGTIDTEGFPKGSWGSSAEGLQVKGIKKDKAVQDMNLTIEGIGNDATLKSFGILCRQTKTVELKNFAVLLCADDCISLDTDNFYTWVHNIDFYYGGTGGDADQAKGDGSLDVKGNSQYQTFSYNHFVDSGKCSLCGMKSESGPNYITYHHNWFDHSDSRHPRIRTMSVHVYNNYYDGNSKYGVGATTGADAFVESNYFRNTKFPMMSSLQGDDVYAGSSDYKPNDYGTFSGESGGSIKSYNNIMTGNTASYAPYQAEDILIKGSVVKSSGYFDTDVHFDAYEASTRNEAVPSTMVAFGGGDTYSNFDTTMGESGLGVKASNITPVEEVPAVVTALAGRFGKADFVPTRTNSMEDTDYAVDTGMKSQMSSYTTKLQAVGGLAGASIAQTCTVTIDPANGNEKTVKTLEKGATIADPGTPASTAAVAGKTFMGWYIGGTTKVTSWPVTVSSTMNIVAIWKSDNEVTVTVMDGTKTIGTKTVEKGQTVLLSGYESKSGYNFEGWYLDAEFTTKFDTATVINADTTIFGKFTEKTAAITITYEYADGSDNETVRKEYEANDSVNAPEVRTRLGYLFTGWKDLDANTAVSFPFKATKNVTLTAQWEKIANYYEVTVDPDNGENTITADVKEGDTFSAPELSKTGYVLDGFYLADDVKCTFPMIITKDTAIKAVWKNASGNTEQQDVVELKTSNVPGGVTSVTSEIKFPVTSKNSDSQVQFTLNGNNKKFGTATTANCITIKSNQFVMEHSMGFGDDPDTDSCSIAFELPEGTDAAKVVVNAQNSKSDTRQLVISQFVDGVAKQVVAPKNVPSSAGDLTFDITGTGKFYLHTVAKSVAINSVTIYYTTKLIVLPDIVVTFKDGADVVATNNVAQTKKFNAPSIAKEGKILKGWKLAGTTDVATFPAIAATSDMVFEAVWENVSQYTVTFNTGDYATVTAQKVNANAKASYPNVSNVKEGYKFEGWYKDAEFKTKWDFTTEVISADTVIYGKFVAGDGSGTTNPGTDPGTNPGTDPGTNPGVDPGTNPTNPSQDEKGFDVTFTNASYEYGIPVYDYTGSPIIPSYIVKYNGKLLKEGIDYTAKLSNNIVAASIKAEKAPQILISGKGNFAQKAVIKFAIKEADIRNAVVSDTVYVESGANINPVLVYNGNVLKPGVDYTGSKIGQPATASTIASGIVIKGAGNFKGSEVTLKVEKLAKPAERVKITFTNQKFEYGVTKEQVSKIVESVTDASGKNVEYKISVDDITAAGKYKVTVTPTQEGYTGVATKAITVAPKVITPKVTASDAVYSPVGAIPSQVTVMDGEKVLTENIDYTLKFASNKKADANAKVTVTLKGNYKGKGNADYKVTKAPMSTAKVSCVNISKFSGAKVYAAKPYVSIAGNTIKASEYTVQYSATAPDVEGCKWEDKLTVSNEGRVYVKVTGKGVNCDTTSAYGSYMVTKTDANDLSKAKIALAATDAKGNPVKSVAYNGTELKPEITVTLGTKTYKGDEIAANFDVTYVNNVNKGKAIIVVNAKESNAAKLVGGKAGSFSIVGYDLSK